jgi:tetratricopeptide (TPR) repeat protein
VSHRPTLAFCLVAWTCFALAATASERFPFEMTIRSAAGDGIEGAAVALEATTGEPFALSGTTDRKGRWRAELPDFSRAYRVHARKDGFADIDDVLDFGQRQLVPGQTAEIGLTMVPPSPEIYYEAGRKALVAGDLDTAIGRIADSVALDPGFLPGWRALTSLYLGASRPAEALEAANAALALDATDVDMLRARYDALSQLGRRDEVDAALDALVDASAASRELAVLVFNRGVDAMKQGNLDASRKRFRQAIEIAPDLHQAHSALAEVLIGEAEPLEGDARNDKLAEAIAALDAAIAAVPRNFAARERKIDVLRAMGRDEEADELASELARLRAEG